MGDRQAVRARTDRGPACFARLLSAPEEILEKIPDRPFGPILHADTQVRQFLA